MVSENPFAVFHSECEKTLADALKKLFPKIQITNLALEKPPTSEFGQLASSLCFELAKQVAEKPFALAKRLVESMDKKQFHLIEYIVPAGAGYINFHLDFGKFSALTIESVKEFDTDYGFVKVEKPLKIIVEHTSVNPLHPIHIGQARNPVLGDTIARLLSARGHSVYRHYYIDDVGRQTSVVAFGYDKLGKPKPDTKPDHFIGPIYTITSCLIEIDRLKKELKRAKTVQAEEEIIKINRELDEWVAISAELESKYPQLFGQLLDKISEDEDPENAVNKLNKAYEEGETKAKNLVREVGTLCFEGFRQTLNRIGVSYDSWDWESDFVLGGHVAEVMQKLKKSPYVFMQNRVWEFNAEEVAQKLNLKAKLGLKEDYKIPSLTLARSDGTTLYTTRDIAYTLWKFQKAQKVVNVIGMEQALAQLQLKIALYALGFAEYADNLIHFAYNLVSLPGYRMSSRRGRYITFDEVMDEAVKRAYDEVSKRSPQLSNEEKQKIADFVGIGAVRYALAEVDPAKPVVFTWDRVLNFETNSAPYIQYTHARACSILRKAAKKPEKPSYETLKEKVEHEIVLSLASFPDAFAEATEYLKPSMIADFANALSDKFNTFYNALPVIKAESQELSDARLALVDVVRIVLRNALNLIGIVAPEKM
ncbi:arginine--tRNA ligase [Candidatus Bathyarchaeota archaeon]|nr:arginine--tRNA ligase [Candidatus Bathyarchaeota archaeon]